ncbi:hypothetical protein DVH24_035948 [Malus domestica]|uniref:Uncharacterized protein n=1 Tax=Malus domestica TaxID=3750 RepID=A0A498JP41_MALDO|nr:hypothetical protein DVH24_035948 [Malus domestica]
MLIWRWFYNNVKREEIQKMFPVIEEAVDAFDVEVSARMTVRCTQGSELNDLVYNGNKVRVTELQRISHDLRKRKCFSQAFQILEWMNKKGIYIFSPVEHVVLRTKYANICSLEPFGAVLGIKWIAYAWSREEVAVKLMT